MPLQRERPRRSWRDLGLIASLAAALVLGFWTLRLSTDLSAMSARLAQQDVVLRAATQGRVVPIGGTPNAPQVRGALAESPDGSVVYLDGLPLPPADRAFEVWLIPPGGQPVGVGVSDPGQGGTQTIRLDRSARGMQTVAVTMEPRGGSPAPTSPILAAANL